MHGLTCITIYTYTVFESRPQAGTALGGGSWHLVGSPPRSVPGSSKYLWYLDACSMGFCGHAVMDMISFIPPVPHCAPLQN